MEMMDLRRSGIYEIRHKPSGRRYVGSAVSIRKRWGEHQRGLGIGRHHSRFLQRAWDKHGEADFEFKALIFCAREDLLMYEQRFLDAWKPEYNTAPTAGSQLGLKMSDEAKAKMSAAAKRTKNFTGRKHSDETKARISKAKTGVKQSIEVVEKRKATIKALGIPPANRKLTNSDIYEIRDLLAYGINQQKIADYYGVSNSVISEIKTQKAYRWVI
jgi:group I intron endonuclease